MLKIAGIALLSLMALSPSPEPTLGWCRANLPRTADALAAATASYVAWLSGPKPTSVLRPIFTLKISLADYQRVRLACRKAIP